MDFIFLTASPVPILKCFKQLLKFRVGIFYKVYHLYYSELYGLTSFREVCDFCNLEIFNNTSPVSS